MKIAYQDKNCHKIQAGNWEDCIGCAFHMNTFGTWPCDLIPHLKCYAQFIFTHSNKLSDVFQL